MRWFKHYNTASEGQSFELLISEKDFETAFIYWWLLEQISKFEDTENDENRGRIVLNSSYFKRKLGLNFQRTSRVLQKIAKTFILEINIKSDETIEVFCPKWLELQENRGGKRGAKEEQKNSKNRQEVRGKNKEVVVLQNDQNEKTNSVQKFNNMFSPKIDQLKRVLVEFGIDRNFKFYMGDLVARFESDVELKDFIMSVNNSKKMQELMAEKKMIDAEKYLVTSLKYEAGIMKQRGSAT